MKTLYVNEGLLTEDLNAFTTAARAVFDDVIEIENRERTEGTKRRTGCVVVLGNATGSIFAAIALGELTSEEIAKYFGFATEKMQRVVRSDDEWASSFTTANEDQRQYGGGVRDNGSHTAISTSGLSAHGDEAVSLGIGFGMKRYLRDFVLDVMRSSVNPYLEDYTESTRPGANF